jgi:hypothetical protein
MREKTIKSINYGTWIYELKERSNYNSDYDHMTYGDFIGKYYQSVDVAESDEDRVAREKAERRNAKIDLILE